MLGHTAALGLSLAIKWDQALAAPVMVRLLLTHPYALRMEGERLGTGVYCHVTPRVLRHLCLR